MARAKASASSADDEEYENTAAAQEDADALAADSAADDAVHAEEPALPQPPQTIDEFVERGGTVDELLQYWHSVYQWPLPIPAADKPAEPDDTKAE